MSLAQVLRFLAAGPSLSADVRRLGPAAGYDWIMREIDEAGLARLRGRLVEGLAGRVLEVGCGSGLSFAHYGPWARVVAIEPDRALLSLAVPRAGDRVRLVAADGERLPFADGSFDAAVFSLVLCSIPAPERALAEVRRVLRPGGEVRALEHVRSERRWTGLLMDLLDPLWYLANTEGCHLNRETIRRVEEAFEEVEVLERATLPGRRSPPFPTVRIRARRA